MVEERLAALALQERLADRIEERAVLVEEEEVQFVAGVLAVELLLLRAQIREEKILDMLMSKSEVTEAPDPTPEPSAEEASAESASATGGDAAT